MTKPTCSRSANAVHKGQFLNGCQQYYIFATNARMHLHAKQKNWKMKKTKRNGKLLLADFSNNASRSWVEYTCRKIDEARERNNEEESKSKLQLFMWLYVLYPFAFHFFVILFCIHTHTIADIHIYWQRCWQYFYQRIGKGRCHANVHTHISNRNLYIFWKTFFTEHTQFRALRIYVLFLFLLLFLCYFLVLLCLQTQTLAGFNVFACLVVCMLLQCNVGRWTWILYRMYMGGILSACLEKKIHKK